MPRSPSKPSSERRFHEHAGRRGELWAELFLRAQFYRVLGRRVKTPVGEIDLIVNTPHGSTTGGSSVRTDGYEIRTAAVLANVPCITTVQGLGAAVQGIEAMRAGEITVRSLQDWARAGA